MDRCVTLTLLFSGFGLSCCSRFPLREYFYVDLEMTWPDARDYCRAKHTDLATITSTDDISRLKSPFSYSWAWIGLWDNTESWRGTMANDANSWRWSASGETSKTGYQTWDAHEPNSLAADESCVMMGTDGSWSDKPCHTLSGFVCSTAGETNTFVFVPAQKTWESAQAYCREHHTDLASIHDGEENTEVYSVKPAAAEAWIGLHRVRWTWSDNTQSSFTFWRSISPNGYGNQFCVCENTLHEWDDEDCLAKYPVICHEVSQLKTVVGLKLRTNADAADPATHAQILQKLSAALRRKGWTHFTLRWTVYPRKQET